MGTSVNESYQATLLDSLFQGLSPTYKVQSVVPNYFLISAMAESQRPKVGVGVIIHDGAGNIIMGERAGSHGAGTLQCPGGHQEYGESFADTAIREVLEETGLEVGNVKFLTATNDVFGEGKHYITIFVTCVIVGEQKVAQVSTIELHIDSDDR